MTWKLFFTSSIGKKFIMALTGIFLITFLIVHCGINAMIFFNDGGETFNHWGHFMGSNLIVRTMELGLFLSLIKIGYQIGEKAVNSIPDFEGSNSKFVSSEIQYLSLMCFIEPIKCSPFKMVSIRKVT